MDRTSSIMRLGASVDSAALTHRVPQFDELRPAFVIGRPRSLILAVAALLGGASVLAQVPPAAPPHPMFAGIWTPSEPARSDQLFSVGLTAIPGSGRLMIEQRADRLTVTITMPDDKLDPLLSINGPFYQTIVYRLFEPRGRSGGAGAGGLQPPSVPTWLGNQLVIPNPRPAARPATTTYSLDGDRLKLETRVEARTAQATTVTEWFTRVR
jgi:hypothetical protein